MIGKPVPVIINRTRYRYLERGNGHWDTLSVLMNRCQDPGPGIRIWDPVSVLRTGSVHTTQHSTTTLPLKKPKKPFFLVIRLTEGAGPNIHNYQTN